MQSFAFLMLAHPPIALETSLEASIVLPLPSSASHHLHPLSSHPGMNHDAHSMSM